MYWKFFSLMSLLSMTNLAYAEKHLLLMGGAGDPAGDTTGFDNNITRLGENLNRSNWKYQVSFNGGHRQTENILRTYYPASNPSATNFSSENYNALIQNYITKINSGDIKSGDQLMIIIDSHGSTRGPGESTHRVSSSGVARNLNTLAGSKSVSLDDLSKIVKLTNEKGIKLGIVDLSCHSGATLDLKKNIAKNAPNTCIISATSPDHYAFSGGRNTFSTRFLEELKPGTSLEEAFLNARLASSYPEYPMISTPANDKIVKAVYSNITPYLYYYSPNLGNKMTTYIMNNSGAEQVCKREENFKSLISQIDNLESTLNVNSTLGNSSNNLPVDPFESNKPQRSIWNPFRMRNPFNKTEVNLDSPSALKLKDLLIEYKNSQDRILLSSQSKMKKLGKLETFPFPKNSGNLLAFKVNYTWKEILELDVESSIQYYSDLQNRTSGQIKKESQDKINFFILVNEKRKEIIRTEPQLANYKVDIAILVQQMNNSLNIAQAISRQEKILYNELYRRNTSVKKDDPCKEIIF